MNAVTSAMVCPLGQIPGLYEAIPYGWHSMYEASETIDRVGFIDQTIARIVLPSPQDSEERKTHLSIHDEVGVYTVVRGGTFPTSVPSVP